MMIRREYPAWNEVSGHLSANINLGPEYRKRAGGAAPRFLDQVKRYGNALVWW